MGTMELLLVGGGLVWIGVIMLAVAIAVLIAQRWR